MYASVVYDIGLDYPPTACLLYAADTVAKQIVADMPEVQRFICVWRRKLYHHQRRLFVCLDEAVLPVAVYLVEQPHKVASVYNQIQKSLYNIVPHRQAFGYELVAYLRSYCVGGFARHLSERKNDDSVVALELLFRRLEYYFILRHLFAVSISAKAYYLFGYLFFHYAIIILCVSSKNL